MGPAAGWGCWWRWPWSRVASPTPLKSGNEDARSRPIATADRRRRPNQGTKPSKTAAAIAARRVAIDTILLRRAQAVQTVNEPLFLQDVDPANTKLRPRRRCCSRTWSRSASPSSATARPRSGSTRPWRRRTARTTYLVRVLMRYQIPKVDLDAR